MRLAGSYARRRRAWKPEGGSFPAVRSRRSVPGGSFAGWHATRNLPRLLGETVGFRIASLAVLAALLSACTQVPTDAPGAAANLPVVPVFSIHHLPTTSPSPFVDVQAGRVQGIVPDTWDAMPLPRTRLPQQGFVASPQIPDWLNRAGIVNGMEVFWVDQSEVGIPSDYYYLVARIPSLQFVNGKNCHRAKEQVFVDHPPDMTGTTFSPGDYVAEDTGLCKTKHGSYRWAYVVAAPGFGPFRELGIPNSGLYVVIAALSGSNSGKLLTQMIHGARFDNTSISQIEQAAIRTQ